VAAAGFLTCLVWLREGRVKTLIEFVFILLKMHGAMSLAQCSFELCIRS
jgi:hypothetical protein